MELDPIEDSGSQMEGNWIIRNIKDAIKDKVDKSIRKLTRIIYRIFFPKP